MKVRGRLKVTGWIIMSLLIVAAIMEGTFQLMGNGMIARLVCTIALIAAAPFLILPLIPEASEPPEPGEDPEEKEQS